MIKNKASSKGSKIQERPLDALTCSNGGVTSIQDRAQMLNDFNFDPVSRVVCFGGDTYSNEDQGEITPIFASKIVNALLLLDDLGSDQIRIVMNCVGGEWYCGMAIYDVIRGLNSPVMIDVYGACMSMGAIILQSGTKRRASENSTIMLHDGEVSMSPTIIKNMEAWAVKHNRDRKAMYEIFARRSGGLTSAKEVESLTSVDFIVSPDEALRYGLIDEIIKSNSAESMKGSKRT